MREFFFAAEVFLLAMVALLLPFVFPPGDPMTFPGALPVTGEKRPVGEVPSEVRPPVGKTAQGESPLVVVHFIQVGEGDSALIQTGEKTVLIDAGDIGAGPRVVSYLKHLKVGRIDYAIATHPHEGHVGGFPQVFESMDVGVVYDFGGVYTGWAYDMFLEALEEKSLPYRAARMGEELELGRGVLLRFLAPLEAEVPPGMDSADNASIVVRVEAGNVTFLFPGDLDARGEIILARVASDLTATVLKVGKHGDRAATSALFLERVQPKVAVISTGAYNEAGHPHEEVLVRLEALGVVVLRTDRHGTTVVRTDGRNLDVSTESGYTVNQKIYR